MPTINEAIWNYAANLSSPEAIVKSYASYLRSGVTKAKEMISVFQLRINDEISAEEVNELYGDSVYYYQNHLIIRSDLINNSAIAVQNNERASDIVDYSIISFNQMTLDGDTITVNLQDLKDSMINDLDTVYYSSVIFSSAEPLLNTNLSTSEKILAKSQMCSEALSQIPNANSEKISHLQSFVESIGNTTYDQQSILSLLFNFCGFSAFNDVTVENFESFLNDIPVVELDNYTGQTPLNGFVNSVTEFASNINVVDVIDFAAGFIFPPYGAFKVFQSIKKYAPKVLGLVKDTVIDFGANIITDINNDAVDPIDFNIDKGEYYSLCANGFNFGGTGDDDRLRVDILSGNSADFSIINNSYSGIGINPTTFDTIFGSVSIGYSANYNSSFGVTRLKPFNFMKYENLTIDELFDNDDMNYLQLQNVLSLSKPAYDFRVNESDYQLRNRLLNGTYISAVCLPIMYLPIYYYIKLLNRLKDYDLNSEEGRVFYSQLYNALFINDWDGSVYPVNVGDVSDGTAMALLQGIGKLLFICSKLLIQCCRSATSGTPLIFNEQIEILDYIINFNINIIFKAYDDGAFNNTHAILASTSTPIITRSGTQPTTVNITYGSNNPEYTMFRDGYMQAGGFNPATTLYDQFFFINNLLKMKDESIKSFIYLPYVNGSGPEPTYHIATDKENIENFEHALMVATFTVVAVIAITLAASYLIKAKRTLTQTQAAIQVRKQALGKAVIDGDSARVTQLTKELNKLKRKERFLNFAGTSSIASTSEVILHSSDDEVIDAVCYYLDIKIGV